MAQRQWRWRHMAAIAALAAGFATVGNLAQSSADIWWTGYGNGPESGPPPGNSGAHNPQLTTWNSGPKGPR